MKQSFKTALLVPLALTASLLLAQGGPQQQQPPAAGQAQQESQQTIAGKIAKSDNGQCVLVDSAGTTYQLDDQSAAKKFLDKKVKVTGTLDTSSNSIHVTEIKAAS